MKENLKNENKEEEVEGAYEQFETDNALSQDKNYKKIYFFSPKKLIKYTLVTIILLCFILLLFNLTQNKNKIISNNLESKSTPKKLQLPLEKDILTIKNELQLIENKITLNDSIKGTDISIGNNRITLITVLITINNKCLTDNCLDCYINHEINYPELSEKEAFHKVFKEMNIYHTYVEGIYYNREMTKRNNGSWVYSAWNKYKRKMIDFKEIKYFFDKYTPNINSEYIQAFLQGYDFTIIDHIYEKNNKNYKYNNRTLKFDEIKLDIKCYRKGDDINYPELNDEEAFDKVFREMNLRYYDDIKNIKNIYKITDPERKRYSFSGYNEYPEENYYVWNNYKREMVLLEPIWHYIYNEIDLNIRNEYLQSAIKGYKFTAMEHIYEKDKRFYKYNETKNIFYEIKLD